MPCAWQSGSLPGNIKTQQAYSASAPLPRYFNNISAANLFAN